MGFPIREIMCKTALLATTNSWCAALEQGKDIAVVFIDFQKAFDFVTHQLLIQKLYDTGIHSCIVKCTESYLQKTEGCSQWIRV